MLFEVKNISKSYKSVPVVENFSLSVEEGDMVALVGKRRRGKTTLMQMLAGIIPVDEGEIYFDGKPVARKYRTGKLCRLRRKSIGFVTTEAILMPDMTVYENLLIAQSHSYGSSKAKKFRAKEVLRTLGLKGKGRFFPKELSVLERQKVCVGRAIINEPKLLICDEPTDILEGYGAEQMMDILEILNSAGYTIILSTHSKRIAGRCRKIYPIHEGLDLSGLEREGVTVARYEGEDLEEDILSGETSAADEEASDGEEARVSESDADESDGSSAGVLDSEEKGENVLSEQDPEELKGEITSKQENDSEESLEEGKIKDAQTDERTFQEKEDGTEPAESGEAGTELPQNKEAVSELPEDEETEREFPPEDDLEELPEIDLTDMFK